MNEGITRRRFIVMGGACFASTFLLPGCAGSDDGGKGHGAAGDDDDQAAPDDDDNDDNPAQSGTGGPALRNAVLLGLYTANTAASPQDAVRRVCQRLDWSWLTEGDGVLLKVACNSANKHPAVTSPEAVRAVVAELLQRGAGRVIVADQAGVGSVRLAEGNQRHGSTRAAMASNGLLAASLGAGAEVYCFDDQDYETGYFPSTLSFAGGHWISPPRIASIVREVDHIVYLPRISSHMIAGYTHGHKIAIGWLREDSRVEMHYKADALHERYVEVNYCDEIRSRLRLTITLAEQFLLDSGPDSGTVAEADPWIVVASGHLANHDALSVAAMTYADDRTPPSGMGLIMPYGKMSDLYNRMLIETIPANSGIPWSGDLSGDYTHLKLHDYQQGIAHDRALKRAYQLLGGVPAKIPVRIMGETPAPEFVQFLRAYGGGQFDLSA